MRRNTPLPRSSTPTIPRHSFYDAIAKQTTNRPVEALKDYEKAIELNDNRAVFRSKLLLDADLAARSAAIARIYNNLGFRSARSFGRLQFGQRGSNRLFRPPVSVRHLCSPAASRDRPGE